MPSLAHHCVQVPWWKSSPQNFNSAIIYQTVKSNQINLGHRPSEAILFNPHLLQLFRRMLQSCLAWSYRNILWTSRLHLTLHQHKGEEIMTEFAFFLHLHLQDILSKTHFQIPFKELECIVCVSKVWQIHSSLYKTLPKPFFDHWKNHVNLGGWYLGVSPMLCRCPKIWIYWI